MTHTTSDLVVAIQALSRVYLGEDRHLVITLRAPHETRQQVRLLKGMETNAYDLLGNGEDFQDALTGLYYTLHERVTDTLKEKREEVSKLEAALAKPVPEWCVVPAPEEGSKA